VDIRSDLYSLGGVLWKSRMMVTGHVVFKGSLRKLASKPPRRNRRPFLTDI
jgi:hypothetical protein